MHLRVTWWMSRRGSDGSKRWDSGRCSWRRRRFSWGWRAILHDDDNSNEEKRNGSSFQTDEEGCMILDIDGSVCE